MGWLKVWYAENKATVQEHFVGLGSIVAFAISLFSAIGVCALAATLWPTMPNWIVMSVFVISLIVVLVFMFWLLMTIGEKTGLYTRRDAELEKLVAKLKNAEYKRTPKGRVALATETALKAKEQLIAAQAQAVPATTKCLRGSGPSHQRALAAQVLGEIGDPLAVPPLIRSLRDADATVRAYSAQALGRIGDRRALTPLREMAAREERDSIAVGYARKALDCFAQPRSDAEQPSAARHESQCSCDLREARDEVHELEATNQIKRETLQQVCGIAYRVLPSPGVIVKEDNRLRARATLTCSVCADEMEVQLDVRFGGLFRADSHCVIECSRCGSAIDIYGLSTKLGHGEPKAWLLVLRHTAPAGSRGGAFKLVAKNARIVRAEE